MHQIDLRHIDLNLLVMFEVLMSERSVTRAAEQLGRTQSAVSHALARLRTQLGDPLLVKAGSGMRPSPMATELIEQVRPILRNVQRVLSPRRAFDPATSSRAFCLALPDLGLSLFPRLLADARKQAPSVVLEWLSLGQTTPLELVDERLDLALGPTETRTPAGVSAEPIGALRWCCFGRRGHPAFARWGRKSWSRWPHVAVGWGDRVNNPVSDVATAAGVARTVAARVPYFAAVAPLLARSDLLATLPAIAMVDAMERFDLLAMPVPLVIEPMPHAMFWSARLSNDPEINWLRGLLRKVIAESLTASGLLMPKQ